MKHYHREAWSHRKGRYTSSRPWCPLCWASELEMRLLLHRLDKTVGVEMRREYEASKQETPKS